MTDRELEPILRVVPGPSDINANGHIFGGWVLSQMDIAAGIVAVVGRNKVQQATPPAPERAVEGVKEDVATIKGERGQQ